MKILRAYFSVFGRMGRTDYAIVTLTAMAIFVIPNMVPVVQNQEPNDFALFGTGLFFFYVMAAATAKRFHDMNWTSQFTALLFIPGIGAYTYIALLFTRPVEPNRYGPRQHFFSKPLEPAVSERHTS